MLKVMAALVVLMGVLTTASPAHAEGNEPPAILYPGIPGNYNVITGSENWAGPVIVSFANSPKGAYFLDVTCDFDSWGQIYVYDGSNPRFVWREPKYPISVPSSCTASVTSQFPTTVVNFNLQTGIKMKVSSAAVRPQRFQPRPLDGYRDRTVLTYTLNQDARVRVVVRNAAGRFVAASNESKPKGVRRSAWDGQSNSGITQRPGVYVIRLTATSESAPATKSTVIRKVRIVR